MSAGRSAVIARTLESATGGGDGHLDLGVTERAGEDASASGTRAADAFGAGEAREQSGARRPAPSRF